MFVGKYNYTQASAKCAEEGGIIAMAADNDTFTFLRNIVYAYRMHHRNQQFVTFSGAFVDGVKGIVNPLSTDWYCENTQGSCPATMPWQAALPTHQECVFVYWLFHGGVASSSCQSKRMVLCKL